MPASSNEESRANQVAKAFFQATTKLSDDNEDILPQVVKKMFLMRLPPALWWGCGSPSNHLLLS